MNYASPNPSPQPVNWLTDLGASLQSGVQNLGNALGPGSAPMFYYPEPDPGTTGDAAAQSQLDNSVAMQEAPAAAGAAIANTAGGWLTSLENAFSGLLGGLENGAILVIGGIAILYYVTNHRND